MSIYFIVAISMFTIIALSLMTILIVRIRRQKTNFYIHIVDDSKHIRTFKRRLAMTDNLQFEFNDMTFNIVKEAILLDSSKNAHYYFNTHNTTPIDLNTKKVTMFTPKEQTMALKTNILAKLIMELKNQNVLDLLLPIITIGLIGLTLYMVYSLQSDVSKIVEYFTGTPYTVGG